MKLSIIRCASYRFSSTNNAGIFTAERIIKKWNSYHDLNLHKSRRIESIYKNLISPKGDMVQGIQELTR